MPSAGEQRVVVKSTDDPEDWSAPPILEVAGNNSDPFLMSLPDGALVLFYSRNLSPQSDLFLRRSEDGVHWSSEVRLTNTPGLRESGAFAVPDSSPGFVDLYWARGSISGPEAQIVHMKVATDTIFAGVFD